MVNKFLDVSNSPLAKLPVWIYSICLTISTYFATHIVFTNIYCNGYDIVFIFLSSRKSSGVCETLDTLVYPLNLVFLGAFVTGGALLLAILLLSVVGIVMLFFLPNSKRKILLLPPILAIAVISLLVAFSLQ